ncbi:hypothetical protein ACFL0Y_01345 [Patescibacteria group bacterium]
MVTNYPFGKELTEQNYKALRSLAQNLTYKKFYKATSFGRGIHNRLRRFPALEGYKKYTSANTNKYYPRHRKKAITLKDVYDKLVEVESLLKKTK